MATYRRTWAAVVAVLALLSSGAALAQAKPRPPRTRPPAPAPAPAPPPEVEPAPAPAVSLPMPPPPAPKAAPAPTTAPAAASAPAPAPAAEPAPAPMRAPAGTGWSAQGPQGLDGESQALTVEVGFPGLAVGYLRSLNTNVDLSVQLGGNYVYEGLISTVVFGGRGVVGLRLRLVEIAGVSVGIHGGVGVFSYFPLNGFVLGVALPVGLGIGIPLGPTLAVSAGVELPMWITFNAAGGFSVPVLGSAGLEYFLDPSWAVTLRARAGPAFNPSGFRFGAPSALDVNVHAGVAFKL